MFIPFPTAYTAKGKKVPFKCPRKIMYRFRNCFDASSKTLPGGEEVGGEVWERRSYLPSFKIKINVSLPGLFLFHDLHCCVLFLRIPSWRKVRKGNLANEFSRLVIGEQLILIDIIQ